jgi:hypothetical protein
VQKEERIRAALEDVLPRLVERAEVLGEFAQTAVELPAFFHGGNDGDFQWSHDRGLRGKGSAHGVSGGERFSRRLDQAAGIATGRVHELLECGGERDASADELRQAVVEALLLPKGE